MAPSANRDGSTLVKGKSTIGVVLGGRSAEREISLQSGRAVAAALEELGHRVVMVDAAEDPCAALREAGVAAAFIALHGRWGEDGCMQGLLESLMIPYTGSGVLASALAMDKVTSKLLFQGAGLSTPAWCAPVTFAAASALGLPLVLKPRAEGSSVGLEIVEEAARLRELLVDVEVSPALMAERYVPGHELTVAVLGTGKQARALGTLEIQPAEGNYDYEAKYERDDTKYLVPAPIPATVEKQICDAALAAHRLLGCSGATRVDFRWDDKNGREPTILEINTLPGMTDHSLLPKIAAHVEMSYGDLVQWILDDASLKA